MSEPAEEPRTPDEHEIVLSWVEEQFRRLGFNDRQAEVLAESGADWHEAKRLLDQHCDPLIVVDLLT